jgi:carbon-monoxide dehydrogenase large subunit
MDYAIPKAEQIPDIILERTVTPSPVNPMGVKGVGEAGTIGATPAIVNAVCDALAPFGIRNLDMPLKAERVWNAIQQSKKTKDAAEGGRATPPPRKAAKASAAKPVAKKKTARRRA